MNGKDIERHMLLKVVTRRLRIDSELPLEFDFTFLATPLLLTGGTFYSDVF